MNILVVNVGSSSTKLRLLGPDDNVLSAADAESDSGRARARDRDRAGVADQLIEEANQRGLTVDAVGHRVVHGGRRHDAVVVDDEVIVELRELSSLAPLHQPPALTAMAALRRALPHVPHVACFDTAFHASLPPAASTYALPEKWRQEFGIRRYGFHGLSHAYTARRAAELASIDPAMARVVSCHLGSGASLAAVQGGRSVDTTMGFTPLEGLVMATRAGSIDPGIVVWLQEHAGIDAAAVGYALERDSGLAGLTGGTGDMRVVMAQREQGDAAAKLAIDVYVHRLRASIAAMAAAMDGVDVVAFTGGVGEHGPVVRALAIDGLGFLGVALDEERNANADGDAVISPSDAASAVVVVAAREDVEIARQVRAALR